MVALAGGDVENIYSDGGHTAEHGGGRGGLPKLPFGDCSAGGADHASKDGLVDTEALTFFLQPLSDGDTFLSFAVFHWLHGCRHCEAFFPRRCLGCRQPEIILVFLGIVLGGLALATLQEGRFGPALSCESGLKIHLSVKRKTKGEYATQAHNDTKAVRYV